MRFHGFFAAFFIGLAASGGAAAEKMFPFTFHETPLTKVIEAYSKATGQRFVIDAALASNIKLTILEPGTVSSKDAFNLLSAALALNSVAISQREGTFVMANARNMERSFIPVLTDLPPLQPERLVTWVVTLHHADAGNILNQVRILPSKDGEMQAYGQNRLLFTDWVSNLYRIKELINQLDKPEAPKPSAPPETKG